MSEQYRILLVEDDATIRNLTRMHLNMNGLEEVYSVSYPIQEYPVKVINTYRELHYFVTRYAANDRYLKGADLAQFNAAWFEENALLMMYYQAGSCSVNPQIGGYSYSADGTVLSVGIDVYTPMMCDDAIGAWHMFSGIKKADLVGVTEVSVYVRRIPQHYYIALFTKPTLQPQTAVEEWRTWLPDTESHEFRQWITAGLFKEGTRYCKYIAVINTGGHNYYISEDFAAIQRDDGKLYWMTENDANSIKRLIAVADQNRVLYEY